MFQINGKLTNKISIEDRAIQYGDGVFETIRIKNKEALFYSEHIKRLAFALELLKIEFTKTKSVGAKSVTVIPKASTSLILQTSIVQSFSWLIGALISSITYFLLANR